MEDGGSIDCCLMNEQGRSALKSKLLAKPSRNQLKSRFCIFHYDKSTDIQAQQDVETFLNIPDMLSGECESDKDCKKPRIQRPKSKKAESCTVRCVNACLHRGDALKSPSLKGPVLWNLLAWRTTAGWITQPDNYSSLGYFNSSTSISVLIDAQGFCNRTIKFIMRFVCPYQRDQCTLNEAT
ncbi:hypothetical protein ACET3Z_011889 [Daucus carota]